MGRPLRCIQQPSPFISFSSVGTSTSTTNAPTTTSNPIQQYINIPISGYPCPSDFSITTSTTSTTLSPLTIDNNINNCTLYSFIFESQEIELDFDCSFPSSANNSAVIRYQPCQSGVFVNQYIDNNSNLCVAGTFGNNIRILSGKGNLTKIGSCSPTRMPNVLSVQSGWYFQNWSYMLIFVNSSMDLRQLFQNNIPEFFQFKLEYLNLNNNTWTAFPAAHDIYKNNLLYGGFVNSIDSNAVLATCPYQYSPIGSVSLYQYIPQSYPYKELLLPVYNLGCGQFYTILWSNKYQLPVIPYTTTSAIGGVRVKLIGTNNLLDSEWSYMNNFNLESLQNEHVFCLRYPNLC